MKKKKNVGIIVGIIVVSVAAFAFLILTDDPKTTPEKRFMKKITGVWHNIPLSDKTWLHLKSTGRCVYYVNGEEHPCVFKIYDRTITVSLRTDGDVSKVFQKIDKKDDFDIREATKLGMTIFDIKIRDNIMKAKMKAISGIRETIAKPITLKKVKLGDVKK